MMRAILMTVESVTPGGGRIIPCLSQSSVKLTAECKKVLAAAEKSPLIAADDVGQNLFEIGVHTSDMHS